ncbi:MAG: ATP-binding protein [FCB group bacterium]|jgi:DNA polymerase III delta prime subunit|nr:ATP-binding protein [FCB group bacterium]
MAFQKATKHKMKLRCAMEGPPGSGKTYSALAIGRALVGENGRIALIDTERGSASKYSDEFNFDVVELDTFAPATFVEFIREAEAEGYDLLIIDSLSHAWMGAEGMLEQVDKIAKRKQYSSNFPAWKDASPQERLLWDTMLGCNMHVIATLRTKTEYVIEEAVGRDGRRRSVPRKVGLAPIQREGLEYEFDVVAEMDMDHNFNVTKTRCRVLTDQSFNRPGNEVAEILHEWLGEGSPVKTKRNGGKTKAAKESKPLPEVDVPHHDDRLRYRNELISTMKERIGALRLPSAVGTHIINVRGYQKSTDMPDAELAAFVDQLGQLLAYREAHTLTFEHMVDRLQEMPDDGSDVLENLLKECAEMPADAEREVDPKDAQDLLV